MWHKWVWFNWERAGLCVILALVAGLAKQHNWLILIQNSGLHAECAKVLPFSCRVQHVCFVKLGVWVVTKLFWRAKSLLRPIGCFWIMSQIWRVLLEQLSVIESKSLLASYLWWGESSFMFWVSPSLLHYSKKSYDVCAPYFLKLRSK